MLQLTPMPTAGLFTRRDEEAAVPLAGVAVDVEITGLCARVSVAHRYVNREATPIEAVYVFPLDEGAAVCGFEAVVDGVVVVGEVQEREQAFERYDEAMERGDGAFLLDEHRPDVFQASIGNLPPGKEVLVRLTYVTELAVDEGRLRFTLPTTIAPRYAPAEDHQGVGQPDAEALNPPVAWSVPYGLDLAVRVAMPGGVSGITSPSHPISLALKDGGAVVALASADTALDRDFVLDVEAPALRAPRAWAERQGDTSAVAVGFVPAFDAVRTPAEIVFVVDRSGSMAGDSIAEVRNALQLCLRSLSAGCCFNIVGFGDTYESLFERSRPYDQASLDAATRLVGTMDADLGGTELRPVLQFVLEQPSASGLPRQVVVLTDGGVTNTDSVIALAAKHRSRARVFTFGIGSAASQHLVRGLARAGGGAAEFIHPGERVEAKVMRQFAKLLSPAFTDARLEWLAGDVTSAPSELPPVFAGQRLLAYGLVTGRMPAAVRLSVSAPSGVLSWEIPVEGTPASGSIVTTLAARARIRELEESAEWTDMRGSRQRGRKSSSVRQQIIDLAVHHGLMSRETSFVAIERRTTPVLGDVQLRRVPIALAHGWGGLSTPRTLATSCTPRVLGQARLASLAMSGGAAGDEESGVYLMSAAPPEVAALRAERMGRGRVPQLSVREFRGGRSGAKRPAALDALVALQDADGSWDLSSGLARAVGQDLHALEQSLPSGADNARRTWATALALAWLQVHATLWEQEWRLLADKGHVWLGQQQRPAGGSDWLDLARQQLSA